MRSNLAIAVLCISVIVICSGAFFLLYQDVHPLGNVRLFFDADSAARSATSIAHEVFPGLTLPALDARLSKNDAVIHGAIAKLGQKQAGAALRDKLPGFFWSIRWKHPGSGNVNVVTNGDEGQRPRGPMERGLEETEVRLNTAGDLLGFDSNIDDTTVIAATASDSTRQLAEEFLRRHYAYIAGWNFTGEKRTERAHRTDVEYSWQGTLTPLGQPVSLVIRASGRQIIAANSSYTGFSDAPAVGDDRIHGITIVLLLLSLGIVMLIVAFKRSRAYEISFRLGIILGIVVALLQAWGIYASMSESEGWELLIPLILGPLFIGGAFILVWSVAESVAREAWRGKFTSVDLLINGYLLHSRVWRSVLQGMAIAAGACLLWALLTVIARAVVPTFYVPPDGDSVRQLAGHVAPAVFVGRAITDNAYLYAAVLLFLLSWLRFRVRSIPLLVLTGAVALGIGNRGGTMPLEAGIVINVLTALVISWGFCKLDVLASLVSFATVSLLMVIPAFFIAGTAGIAQSGFVLVGVFAGLAILGVVGLLTRDSLVDLEAITPAFVRHITERERLQRELEIARDVQMSFLPRQDPVIPGADIASRCVPALEVGGDYYDFIKLGPDLFGVVVGDVSGKGTQAAFYMTLTKGFLKAVTRVSESPAEVLIQLNELFYDNVERGTFISMVYGVFDLRKRTVTIARAGHNPPILKRANGEKGEFIQPAGLALGLEAGTAFAETIKEYSTEICAGDLYVFYTDGFTEAMDRQNEEYGEERLRLSMEKHAAGTASEIMNGLFRDVKEHAGRTKQHDDMTIVVVKL